MSTEHADPGHGHSPAAWTSVTIMLIAFVIGTVAFFFDVQWLVWASAGLLLIGAIVGWILARAADAVAGAKTAERVH